MNRVLSTIAMMAVLLAACGDSNPLIGKWKSVADDCVLNSIEFTEKLIIMEGGIFGGAIPYTYSRDGARYVAATGDGRAFVFEKAGRELKMVSPFTCQMAKV